MPSEAQRIIEGEVRKVKIALEALGQKLEEGKLRVGLEKFKDALDSARLSIWAILTAGKPAEYPSVLLRIRLQRAVEMCENIRTDINNGTPAGPAELRRFCTTLKTTLKQVEPVVQA